MSSTVVRHTGWSCGRLLRREYNRGEYTLSTCHDMYCRYISQVTARESLAWREGFDAGWMSC